MAMEIDPLKKWAVHTSTFHSNATRYTVACAKNYLSGYDMKILLFEFYFLSERFLKTI